MNFYKDKYKLMTLCPINIDKKELEEKYNQLRILYRLQELQISRLIQFFHMETEYKQVILGIQQALDQGDIDLIKAIGFLEDPEDTLYDLSVLKTYDTEI